MSIATEITRIKGKVADSFTACEAKGATIPESEVIANLPTCIASIPTGSQAILGTKTITANGTYNAVDDELDGYSAVTVDVSTGSGEVGNGQFRVRFIDYDGTILKTEWVDNGEDATPPSVPVHNKLIFQEWNRAYTNLTKFTDIGAIYETEDGKTHLFITVTPVSGYQISMQLSGASKTMKVEWGDGKSNTYSGTSNLQTTHTYASYGDYEILISLIYGTEIAISYNNTSLGLPTVLREAWLSNCRVYGYGLNAHFHTKIILCKSYKGTSPGLNVLGSALGAIVYPKSVNAMLGSSSSTFSGVGSLALFCAPENLTDPIINTSCFKNCVSLEQFEIPVSVTTINAEAFVGCRTLTRIIIPRESVVTLSAISALTGIPKYAKIYVPDALVNDYKTATNWVTYADYIYPISEMV